MSFSSLQSNFVGVGSPDLRKRQVENAENLKICPVSRAFLGKCFQIVPSTWYNNHNGIFLTFHSLPPISEFCGKHENTYFSKIFRLFPQLCMSASPYFWNTFKMFLSSFKFLIKGWLPKSWLFLSRVIKENLGAAESSFILYGLIFPSIIYMAITQDL